MRALEETRNTTFKRAKKNTETRVSEASKQLFRVVVNNYRQQESKTLTLVQEENSDPTDDQKGLPPQPKGYLKFPDYDWF